MNFLIDANLPRRIVHIFQERGHDTVHTLDLPEGNAPQTPRCWIIPRKTTVLSQRKIQISAHPFGCKTVPASYY